MTFPITRTYALWDELYKFACDIPLIVKDRDGKELQLDGVEPELDVAGTAVTFVLRVGPKDSK